MEFLVGLYGVTIGINNGPQEDEEDEERTNGNNRTHVQHLGHFVGNKYPKESKKNKRDDPCPHEKSIGV